MTYASCSIGVVGRVLVVARGTFPVSSDMSAPTHVAQTTSTQPSKRAPKVPPRCLSRLLASKGTSDMPTRTPLRPSACSRSPKLSVPLLEKAAQGEQRQWSRWQYEYSCSSWSSGGRRTSRVVVVVVVAAVMGVLVVVVLALVPCSRRQCRTSSSSGSGGGVGALFEKAVQRTGPRFLRSHSHTIAAHVDVFSVPGGPESASSAAAARRPRGAPPPVGVTPGERRHAYQYLVVVVVIRHFGRNIKDWACRPGRLDIRRARDHHKRLRGSPVASRSVRRLVGSDVRQN
eukprot:4662477-Prymnesium_polylepis.1